MGHVDIVTRSAALFDRVVVGIYARPSKSLLFSTTERTAMMKKAVEHITNVQVRDYDVLTIDFARKVAAEVVIRGLRSGSDFEYEFEMAFMNKKLAPDIEFIYMMTSLEYQFVSSSTLKEVVQLHGDISDLVPSHVHQALIKKYGLK
jgi:pantetheine-phosphate adenylyltransferase